MNFLLIILVIICTAEMHINGANHFNEDYCSPQKTNCIKGIFVLIIFICHTMDYFTLGDGDQWVQYMSEYLKQLIVVPILFYSGFGIMESIQKKGLPYIKKMPVNRILRTMLFADLSVLLFAALYLVLGIEVPLKKLLLSLIFWDKIQNNTWYFFVIIFLYLFTYISFRIFHKNYYIAAMATVLLSTGLFFFLIRTRDIFWYNTFFCYHFGMWYSLLRRRVEKIVMHNDVCYCIAMLLTFLTYSLFRTFGSFYYFIICGCIFTMLIVGLSMKVSIDNAFLQFLGKHVFGIYVFQRIPMLISNYLEMNNVSKFIFCFLVTCIISLLFDWVMAWLDRVLFCRQRSQISSKA